MSTSLPTARAGTYIVITFNPFSRLALMKTRIVRIGNSQGVRIPKPLLEQSGLDGDVELHVTDAGILIAPVRRTREGWKDAAQLVRERGEDGLLDEPTPTDFDEAEWVWE